MQPTILAITLVIMAVTLVLILRAIVPTTGPEPDADAPKMRTRLIWVMIVFGMVLSVMPGYAFLSQTRLETDHLSGALAALSRAGVPYSNEQIAMAEFDAFAQADHDATYDQDLFARYGENVLIRDFDGDPNYLSEMDALVAYLQML